MNRSIKLVLILGVAHALGCRSESTNPRAEIPKKFEESISIVAEAIPSDAEMSQLLAAKDALFQKLSGRLQEVMFSRGPSDAIEVCRDEAVGIAQKIGEEKRVHIGRTSVRLRNPKNKPPQWAEPLVEKATEVPTFVKLSNGHAAALLPIKLQTQCLTCHGPKEGIAKDVRDKLAKHYPEDRATEFKEGDLRGWFWVELLGE
jgi:hypothetical protein